MFSNREKVKDTAFSRFFLSAPSSEKKKVFSKIIDKTISEQKAMVEKAEKMEVA